MQEIIGNGRLAVPGLGSCFPTQAELGWGTHGCEGVKRGGFAAVVSHTCDGKKSQGWGTEGVAGLEDGLSGPRGDRNMFR